MDGIIRRRGMGEGSGGELPPGYTGYGYLTRDNVANSGIIIPTDMLSDNTVSTEVAFSGTSGSSTCFMGTRNGSSGTKQFALFVKPSTKNLGYWFGGTDSTKTNNALLGSLAKNIVVVKPVGDSQTYPTEATLEINGTDYQTGSTSTGATWKSWFGLFRYASSASATGGTNYSIVRIGRTTITDKNGITTLDLIPCYNGTIYGYYDTVGKSFYYDTSNYSHYSGGNW